MPSYNPQNRQVGQLDEENWQLIDFLGPIERWSKMGSENDVIYLFVKPDEKSFFSGVSPSTKRKIFIRASAKWSPISPVTTL
jgi:hypothetical protein